MKILIILICAGCVIFLGNNYTKYYKKRMLFFNELNLLCNCIESDIKFKQHSIRYIISKSMHLFKSELGVSLNNYFIKKNGFYNVSFLNDKENDILKNFYISLGKCDIDGEINNIQNYKTEFGILIEDCNNDYKKFGALGNKLGVVSALLIVIIFI